MKKTQIQITGEHFIASGAYCDCYRHPNVNDQCIKIKTTNKKASKRLKTDIAYFKKLHAKQSDLRYVADYLGPCQTSLGLGHAYQCVLDSDGTVSKTLEHYLNNDILEPDVFLKELHSMATHLLNNRILISDIHAKNILVQRIDSLSAKPVLVDGIGDKIAITVLNAFAGVTHNKIIRRWNNFINRLIESYPHYKPLLQERYLSENDITA